jgi:hypothetical protein
MIGEVLRIAVGVGNFGGPWPEEHGGSGRKTVRWQLAAYLTTADGHNEQIQDGNLCAQAAGPI